MLRTFMKRHLKLIVVLAILLILIFFILPISIPLLVAFLTALVLNPLIRLFQNRLKLSRKLSVILVFLLFTVLLGVTGTYTVTKTTTQLVNFVEAVPSYMNQLNDIYNKWDQEIQQYTSDFPDEFLKEASKSIEGNLERFGEKVRNAITLERVGTIFAKVPDFLISLIVYMIALFLFMLELPSLRANFYNLLKPETAEKVAFMNARLSSVFIGFFKAQFLVSLIILAVSLVGLFIITPEVALIMSLIIWIIDLIPIIGSIVILGPWSLFLLLSGDISTGVQLAVLAVILLAIRRTVEPKVMGHHIGLSPLATLISMFIGLQIFGILGFIIGPIIIIAFNSAKEAGIIQWNIKI